MKNNKMDKKDDQKTTRSNWIVFGIYVISIGALFDYLYDCETDQDLTISIGTIFLIIIMTYTVTLASGDLLNNSLKRPLNILKRFLSSPIVVVALGTIILLFFLGNVLHFSDII